MSEYKTIRAGKSGYTFIYTLRDPISNLVRYIGKADDINIRLNEHIRKCDYSITYKNNWIKSILKKGYLPIIEVIDEVPYDEWGFWEEFWMDLIRSWGCDLTNLASGGQGGNLGSLVNSKISKALSGIPKSEEHKKKLAESRKGKRHSESTILKMSESKKGSNNHMYGKTRLESSKIYRKVLQLNLDGEIIKYWKGVTVASRELNINRCTITDVCNGRKKTAGGFKWKYTNERI